ncbi:MAG: HRDC domain-containing protein [Planctomycetes bacterium]|nr:HRDC domain-containing protein [Planctomycetota bacterium]
MKKGGTLTRRESQVLRHLAQWREELAQRQNTLVSRILTDDVLVAIARTKPKRLDELARVTRRLTRRQVDLWGADLLECVKRGASDSLSRDDQPRTHTGRRDDDRTRGLRSLLSAYAEATAARHGLAMVRLVKSAEIDEIARDPSAAEDMGLNVLRGWREIAVGRDLLAIARGRLGVTWDAEIGRVDVFEFDD